MTKQSTPADALSAFKADLKSGNLAPGYLLWGEETYLLHHYLEQLQKKCVDPVTAEFNFHRYSSESFSIDALARSLEKLPMLAERTMIRVDDVDLFHLPEDARAFLAELLEDLPPYCCLVFAYGASEFKPDKRQWKFYDALTNHLRLVEFPLQTVRELSVWITRHFRALGKTISPALCQYLVEITGGSMSALLSEIDKIAAFTLGDTVTKADIDAVTEPVLDAVVFQMTDLLAAGNYAGALVKLQALFQLQQEPIAILGAVGANFRRISAAKIFRDNGQSAGALASVCGISGYAAQKAMDASRRFSAGFCANAARLILETDLRMKTSYDDPQRLLEQLLFRLAQEASHG